MKTALGRYGRSLSLIIGSVVVALWTILRHISNGINFDVVGQIGLAQQWAHGLHSGAQLGATNYVLKMPLYALVNGLGFLSPMNRLLVLALICNVATFCLLFVLFEKILKLCDVRDMRWLYPAMLWLATIAGNVYWTDYANSRNLETVGGLLFIYLVLRFYKTKRATTAALIALTGSVVFFADSLQLYVCGLGICIYAGLRLLTRPTRPEAIQATSVVAATFGGFLGAKLLSLLVRHILHINFLMAPHQSLTLQAQTIAHTAQGAASSTLDIFGANVFKHPYGLNTIRELLSLAACVGIVALIVRVAPKLKNHTFVRVGLAVIITNYLIYLASGQVLVWATSRYLVMIPLLTIGLVVIAGNQLPSRYVQRVQVGWLALTALSCIMLTGALVTHWPQRHAKDAHIYATVAYLQSSGYQTALSSREIGVTTSYFAQEKINVLPLLCAPNHRLVPTDLFYDRAPFERLASATQPLPLIVPTGGIVSGPVTCSMADIEEQLGGPLSTTTIPRRRRGSTVLCSSNPQSALGDIYRLTFVY